MKTRRTQSRILSDADSPSGGPKREALRMPAMDLITCRQNEKTMNKDEAITILSDASSGGPKREALECLLDLITEMENDLNETD